MNWTYVVILAIVMCIISAIVPLYFQKRNLKKLMNAMEHQQYQEAINVIDSFSSKMCYSAFYRESMRLSVYMSMQDKNKVEDQIAMMQNMRLKRKEKAVFAQRGFYYYLQVGKVRKAKEMVEMAKNYAPESVYKDILMQYSILLKKESKYIPEMQKKLEATWDGVSELDDDKRVVVGVFEYLLGLQYMYMKDTENMLKYFKPALEHCQGTPYEAEIQQIIDEKA